MSLKQPLKIFKINLNRFSSRIKINTEDKSKI